MNSLAIGRTYYIHRLDTLPFYTYNVISIRGKRFSIVTGQYMHKDKWLKYYQCHIMKSMWIWRNDRLLSHKIGAMNMVNKFLGVITMISVGYRGQPASVYGNRLYDKLFHQALFIVLHRTVINETPRMLGRP